MPISFQPAAPFAPEINARFGATDQYNRIFPTLAGLYEAAGRNITQASAGTAQNITQGNIASAENQTRRTLQSFQIDAEEQQQQRQIAAQEAAQMRQIQAQAVQQRNEENYQMARMDMAITQQEQQENVARINGLAEIERQLSDRTMTPEQAADARYELATKINAHGRRASYQQAKAAEARAAQVQQEMVATTKAQAMSERFMAEWTKQGGTFIPDMEGKMRPAYWNSKTQQFYNPFTSGGRGEGEGAVKEYDWGKALKDAKAEAEAAYPIQKDKDEEIRVSKERNDYVQQIMERDRHKQTKPQSAVPGLPAQGAAINPQAVQQATRAPSAPQPVQRPDPVVSIAQSLPPEQAQTVLNLNQAMKAIMSKGVRNLTQAELAELERLRNELKKYIK